MLINFEITANQADRLHEVADQLGIDPQSLAQAALLDLLARPQSDFQAAVEYLLKKNQKLYERLSK